MSGRRIPLASFNPDVHEESHGQEGRYHDTTLTPEAADLVDEINGALDMDKYEWAAETLEGIKTTILERGVCSDGQKRAIRNILDTRR